MDREELVIGLKDRARITEAMIRHYLPKEEGLNRTVTEAMNYSVLAGGKRLRPILMLESYRMYGGDGAEGNPEGLVIAPFMAAMEFIHNYSLVHDDLPAMDNDMYRRGKKTTHAVYGAGMATLAGDGLLNLAFETAFKAFDLCKDNGEREAVIKALKILSNKAGIDGMIGGQCADLEAGDKDKDAGFKERLLYIHLHKTAAMIESSLMIGAVLAGGTKEDVKNAEVAGEKIGLAFQIRDDILDAGENNSDSDSDSGNGKLTWVTMYGDAQARDDVERLSGEALKLLDVSGGKESFLRELIQWMITREL